MDLPLFKKYEKLFRSHGYPLFMVGGTSRDLLLGQEPSDFDFVTSATPEQERSFLPDADYSFAKFGSIKFKEEGKEIDVTTFREEGEYKDFRHPSYIRFISSPEEDSKRRDFTINALYLDGEGNVLDFHGGLKDLREKKIRFIGNPDVRIQEDPLRILRAERFAKRLGFTLEEETDKAIKKLRPLLAKLNPLKVKQEMEKM